MELKTEEISAPWLDPHHPNFEKWRRSRSLSEERGKLVKEILSKSLILENLRILDLGSGEGGTAKVFSEANKVVSLDLSLLRLQRQSEYGNKISRVNADALFLPFKKNSFDLVIIQDVIEHVANPLELISLVHSTIKEGGSVYLSTPNKLSFINFISDPHFGLPVISLLRREDIRKYFLKFFRKKDYPRKDIAQLLSLTELESLFQNKFKFNLQTKQVVKKLIEGNKGIVWSSFHLSMIRALKKIGLGRALLKISDNNLGIVNKYFTPTYYFILKKSGNI